LTPDGQHLLLPEGRDLVKVEIKTGKSLDDIPGPTSPLQRVVESHDGKWLAGITRERSVVVMAADTWKVAVTFREHKTEIQGLAIRPDGKWVATSDVGRGASLPGKPSEVGEVKIWEAETGKIVQFIPGLAGGVGPVAFSPAGGRIAFATGPVGRLNRIKVCDPATGKELLSLQGNDAEVRVLAFHPQGKILATAAQDPTITLWNLDAGKPIAVLQGHTDLVADVAFSADGKTLASAGRDEMVRLWDVATGNQLRVFRAHFQGVSAVKFASGGQVLITRGGDKTVK